MINEVFIIMGIVIMISAIPICLDLLTKSKEKMLWLMISILIIFFLAGYIVYFIFNLKSITKLTAGDHLIAQILFWGSVFVIMILLVSQKMFNSLNKLINDLKILSEKYQRKSDILLKVEEKLKEKNIKLEELVEEFYTYRLGLEKETPKNKILKENINIKEKIDKIITND